MIDRIWENQLEVQEQFQKKKKLGTVSNGNKIKCCHKIKKDLMFFMECLSLNT